MGKGIAQRRRVKQALNAAKGNLHRIAIGKAVRVELPDAPKEDKLPASLRKMMALQEAARKQEEKAASKAGAGTGLSNTEGSAGTKSKGPWDASKPSPAQEAGDQPGSSGRQEAAAAGKAGKGPGGAGAGAMQGGNPFHTEVFGVKKLKAKKKEYLKRKAEKKKQKKTPGGSDLVVEKELQLRDKVKFGEVVDAPLTVHLKRKHWADEHDRSASERCKDVFMRQMEAAKARMAGATADEGIALGGGGKGGGRGGRAGGDGAGGKGAGPSGRGGAAGGKGAAAGDAKQGKKRKAEADPEAEALRLQVIESYRRSRRGAGLHNATVGNATLSSLASLVGKPPATHTLA